MGNYMIIHKHLNHRIFLAKVVLSSPSPLSIPSFSTKVVTAIFSSLTAREQWEKFLHYKLLVIRIISPLMSEATSLRCLWRRTSSAQNPWSLLLCVLNKPSVYAVGLLQLSLLMLAVVFWTCLLNPPCNTTHLGLWSVPFSPSEMLVPVIGVLSINNDTKFPKLKLLHVNRLRGIFFVPLFATEHFQNHHTFWKWGVYWIPSQKVLHKECSENRITRFCFQATEPVFLFAL